MSYCRWSTDDFTCDLYCYESSEGYVTHVASYKDSREKDSREPIGLAYDGQSFLDETPEDFLATLTMLKEAGYTFPFERIRERLRGEE